MALQATNSDEAPDVGQAFLPAAGFPAGAGPLSKAVHAGRKPGGRQECPTCVFNGADTPVEDHAP
jgi:hypothetical protein